MTSQPRRSSLQFLASLVRSGATYVRLVVRGGVRTHVAIASVILAAEAIGLLLRVPGLGWWERVGILYGIMCVLGLLIFIAEVRSMRAAVVFARRERQARRHMELPDDY